MTDKKNFKLKYDKSVLVNVEEEIPLSNYTAEKIKQIIREKNLYIKDITLKAGFCNETIWSRIMKGKHHLNTNTLYKICKGLDCKSSDLLPF
jgi:DNA-binding Xre family transcriptional regulator